MLTHEACTEAQKPATH